ncbi:MAG: 5'-methylthioadenosine/adenosylhomocysteine nucleosidase [Bacillota bacterium]|mgnify:CR=1 FL=1|jgi:adenosylhomocysteine nucleosidase|nr:5'-methylthioadenosine/adenosylhomocysteine nucleosidase [Bacillota bacterium]HHU43874.1 5'-methylthioadenosine/adenosylhomocysteine nucleosidase [Clostridiales bacterium]
MIVGIIIAMSEELKPYEKHIKSIDIHYGKQFHKGKIGENEIVICLSGVGKVNAAFATAVMVDKYKPSLIINTGVSGGLGQKKPMDIVVADKVAQHDVDTSPLGDPKGFVSGVDRIYFETSKTYTQKIYKYLENASLGVMVCGDQFIADKKKASEIVKTFGAIACDMESGAIAQVAHMTDTELVLIRGIADSADDKAPVDFKKLVSEVSLKTYNAVKKVIERL